MLDRRLAANWQTVTGRRPESSPVWRSVADKVYWTTFVLFSCKSTGPVTFELIWQTATDYLKQWPSPFISSLIDERGVNISTCNKQTNKAGMTRKFDSLSCYINNFWNVVVLKVYQYKVARRKRPLGPAWVAIPCNNLTADKSQSYDRISIFKSLYKADKR